MAKYSDIANVQISLDTASVGVSSFAGILAMAPHNLSTSNVLGITSANDLLDLGLSSNSKLYALANAVFSQTPHVNQLYIGKVLPDAAVIKVSGAIRGDYTITVKGVTSTYTALDSDTASSIATALGKALIANSIVAKFSKDEIIITTSEVVTVTGRLEILDSTTSEDYSVALTRAMAMGYDIYGILATTRLETDVLKIAEWAESNTVLFGTASSNKGITDGSSTKDIAYDLMIKGYLRTFGFYHKEADSEYVEAAIMSRQFSYYPGQANWAEKKLAGITGDNLSTTESQAAQNKYFNTYEKFKDFSLTRKMKVVGNEWIDIIRGRDWLQEEMQADVVTAIVNAKKVPYTDEGIQVIKNAMLPSLDLGVARGVIAPQAIDDDNNVIPSYVINVPKASDISDNQKASRILNDVYFTARLAGAINLVNIQGSLAYSI